MKNLFEKLTNNLKELERKDGEKTNPRIYVDIKAIQKYLETKKYLEKEIFPKIKITFSHNLVN